MMMALKKKGAALFDKYGYDLLVLSAAMMPVRLILTYIFLVPLIILWLLKHHFSLRTAIEQNKWFAVPLYTFLVSMLVSSFLGINTSRSIRAFASLFFFSLLCFVVKDVCQNRKNATLVVLIALSLGQCLTSIHTVLESIFPSLIPPLFLGKVTESGQLALTIPAIIGVVVFLRRSNTNYIEWPSIWPFKKPNALLHFLSAIVLPLLFAALIINLKRGPWMGLLVGGVVVLFCFEKRLVVPLIVAAILTVFCIQPVRTRLAQSYEDFFIAGGRSAIWQVGSELSIQYPLGIGLKNSPFLRNFSLEIPPELTHFHSNVLNILVEGGWITLAIYLWWIWSILFAALKRDGSSPFIDPVLMGIGCSLLAWQVAGLVEYNFGDAEVVLIAFLMMGTLLGRLPNADISNAAETSLG